MANLWLYKTFGFCYLVLLTLILADDHGVVFLYPTLGLTLNYQDIINVTWTSPFPKPMLFTFCFNATNNDLITESQQNVTPYNGSQIVQVIWQGVSTCDFDLRPNSSAGYGANSPDITVLPTARAAPSSFGLPTSTSTSSSSSSSGSTASATGTGVPNTSNTGTATPSSNGGLSGGAKAGIGVGVAVGVVAVIAGVAFFFLRRRKSKAIPSNANHMAGTAEEYYAYGQKYQPVDNNSGSYVQMQQIVGEMVQKPSELSSDVTHELPGGELRHEMSPETVAGNTAGRNERRFSWEGTRGP